MASHGPQEFILIEKMAEGASIYALTAVHLPGKD